MYEANNPEQFDQPIPPQTPVPAPVRTVFTKADYLAMATVLATAWCYTWGFRLFGMSIWPVSASIYLGANYLYVWMQKRSLPKESLLYALFILTASFQPVLYDRLGIVNDSALQFGTLLFLLYHGAGIYFVFILNHSRIDNCLNERSILDLLRGAFVIPFAHCYRMIQAALSGCRKLLFKKHGKDRLHSGLFKQIFVGFGIGCLLLLIAIPLLAAADISFSNFVSHVSAKLIHVISDLFNIFQMENVFMLLIACYLYGLTYGAGKSKVPVLPRNKPVFTLAAFISLLIVCGAYLSFFVVKLADVMATVSHGQENFSQSAYARAGFFELCWIAFLNVLIFYLSRFMAKWNDPKIKIMSTVLCAETLAFVGLAFYKMRLYINYYGYTFKRVLTSWFMIVLFVGFLLFIIKTWRDFNAIRITLWFGAVSFLILSYGSCFFVYP